jgi:hypothetical protein
MRKISLVVVVCLAFVHAAIAQSTHRTANSGFSFDVYGDSRSMMYLPYQAGQEADARKLMVDMFELVLPQKVSEEVVEKDVKLIYDPSDHELVQIVMPFMTKSEVTTLTFDKGWVTSASVEDVKLLPGVNRTMFRLEGGEWVAREAVRDIKSGNAKFVLSTGDLVWWGGQGGKPSDNPYWTLVDNDVLEQLPEPDKDMKQAGLRPDQQLVEHGLGMTLDDLLWQFAQICHHQFPRRSNGSVGRNLYGDGDQSECLTRWIGNAVPDRRSHIREIVGG